ncbi:MULTISPECIES: FecR family protein [unclassified Corallococcus]|uniref:FecR family protein n=1 Tax=unclassified Corallococcus TaxID=2685029 RepID=UPI001A8E65B5|nr:FecR family protein [Corallococcus sp. NCRR]MBN9685665.1 FecR domain-containing protein [Corallococcus sp. NCSPR001]WAS82889.1 FecR family protein [Corallococcus sp. NCRR]
MRKTGAPLMLSLLLSASPVAGLAAEADSACGGLTFDNGRLTTGQPLEAKGPRTEACLREVAEAVKARPAIRSLTVAAKLPDAERLDGQGLAVAKAAAEVLVNAGIPRTRVSFVAPPADANTPGRLQLAYVERPMQVAVARLRTVSGQVTASTGEGPPTSRLPGDSLYAGELVATDDAGRAELALADGSVLFLSPRSAVRLGTLELTAERQRKVLLDLVKGTVETQAAPGGAGSTFEVRTRGAVAGVRGTRFRVSQQEDGTSRLETLEGKVALVAEAGSVDVDAGFGSRARAGQAPEAPRALLAAPALERPRGGTYPKAPSLVWKAVPGAKVYRVEMGTTADFAGEVKVQESANPTVDAAAPGAGKWFWRVLAVDADGFVGYPSKIFSFDIAG